MEVGKNKRQVLRIVYDHFEGDTITPEKAKELKKFIDDEIIIESKAGNVHMARDWKTGEISFIDKNIT